jgi:PAS domain-containing protein
MPSGSENSEFFGGGGHMGALIRAFDWKTSTLGSPETWPAPLKEAVRQLLATSHPMFIWWGPRLVQFYNDAYSESIGPERHPSALGQEGRECWQEIWPIIGPQIDYVLAGRGATWNENALVPITRHGRREDVYWTYAYSPLHDPAAANGVGGVLVVCTETTELMQNALVAAADRNRMGKVLEQSPAFMALLQGPEHRFEFANAAYMKLVQNRPVLGKTVAEAFPEIVAQGYVDLLDRAYRTGEAVTVQDSPIWFGDIEGAGIQNGYLDFTYQPVKDAYGQVSGIFVQGVDVMERKAAQDSLRETVARFTRAFSVQGQLVKALK